MTRSFFVLILLWGTIAAAQAPCQDEHARLAACRGIPTTWLCLSPQLAAVCPAELDAARAGCKAEAQAIRAEAATILRRDVGKAEAEKQAVELKLGLAIGLAKAAEAEAAARWTTLEVVAWIAGGVAVGAAGGAAAYWLYKSP